MKEDNLKRITVVQKPFFLENNAKKKKRSEKQTQVTEKMMLTEKTGQEGKWIHHDDDNAVLLFCF